MSSLELIEVCRKESSRCKQEGSVNEVIELISEGDSILSKKEKRANQYPSSPTPHPISSPSEIHNERFENSCHLDSEKLLGGFQNDTSLDLLSTAAANQHELLDNGNDTGELEPLKYSSVNESVRKKPKARDQSSMLNELLGDNMSSSEISISNLSNTVHQGSPLNMKKIASKWLQTKNPGSSTFEDPPTPVPEKTLFVSQKDGDLSAIEESSQVDIMTNGKSGALKIDLDNSSNFAKPASVVNSNLATCINRNNLIIGCGKKVRAHINFEAPEKGYLLDKFILNSRAFTEDEAKREVSQALANSSLKREFNLVNKILKDPVALREELLIDMDENLLNDIKGKGLDLKEVLEPTEIIHLHSHRPLLKILRRCKSVYDANRDLFYPREPTIKKEKVSILLYDALEFFSMLKSQDYELKFTFESFGIQDDTKIILLNDYTSLERGLQNLEDKRYRDRIQDSLGSQSTASQNRRQSKKARELEEIGVKSNELTFISEKIALQEDVRIFLFGSTQALGLWLKSLIPVVSRIRYDPQIRHLDWSHINVKSAQTPQEVVSGTLEQLNKMTNLRARRVSSFYQSFQSLYKDITKGFIMSGDDGQPMMPKNAERAMVTLLTSDDPDELIYVD
ncbi:LAMI_0E09648g1_1 [Lachancea mirantina]|uniref:LAMI_0E09648g1_1 n=1 Tax=Lachancea mirantina TaxID=1230905 RepID=A0A1G4JNT2_9SACH|nr:LAMI_0E09648g1_1 [Lachancea mirantina]